MNRKKHLNFNPDITTKQGSPNPELKRIFISATISEQGRTLISAFIVSIKPRGSSEPPTRLPQIAFILPGEAKTRPRGVALERDKAS